MKSANDQLLDLYILRGLLNEKLKNGLSNDVKKEYKKIFDELIKRVKEEDTIDIQNMNKIIKELKYRIDPNITLHSDLTDVATSESAFTINVVNSVIGASVIAKIPKDSTLLKIANTSLFEGYNSIDTFKAFDDGLKHRLEGEIKQAVVLGESIPQIRQRLIDRAGVAINQAETLARTFTAVVINQARDEVYRENEHLFKGYKFHATLDSRTTFICASRDGATYDINKKPINTKFDFRTLPLHHNCRSILTPITKSYRELGIDIDEIPEGMRASVNGQVPASTTFDKWLKAQPKSVIEKYLGAGRYKLYKEGKITLSDLVTNKGEVLTIEELKTLK